jgi:hypothetical protein
MNSSVVTHALGEIRATSGVSEPKAWAAATVYATLLLSSFSLRAFTIGETYVFEIPLAICILFGCLLGDPLAKLVRLALTDRAHKFYIAVFLMLPFCLIGAMTSGSTFAAIADLRSNLVIVLGIRVAFVAKREGRLADLLRLAVMCSILSVGYWGFATFVDGLTIAKYATSYMAAVVGILLSVEFQRRRELAICLVCLTFIAVVAFWRQYWIVTALSLLFVFHSVLTSYRGAVRRRAIWLLVGGCILAIGITYSQFENLVRFFISDQARYSQSVAKTNDVMRVVNGTGDLSTSDAVRLAYFTFIAEHPLRLIVPHGLGYREYINNVDPYFDQFVGFNGVSTIDSALFYVAFHYGLIACILLVAWLSISFVFQAKHKGKIRTTLLYSILLIPLLFDGGQIVSILRAYWIGTYVGLIACTVRMNSLVLRMSA